MTNMKANSARIRSLREARMWTQEQLSEVSGVGLRTIQRVEQGDSVSMDTLKALGAALKVDGDTLVEPPAEQPGMRGTVVFLERSTSATALASLASAQAFVFSNEDPSTPAETDALGTFMDSLRDWGDIWSDLDPGDRLRAGLSLREHALKLEELGFWVFALVRQQLVRPGQGAPIKFDVAFVAVVRSDSSKIVTPSGDASQATLPTLIRTDAKSAS